MRWSGSRRSGSRRWRLWSLTCGSSCRRQCGRGRGIAGTPRWRRRRMTCRGGSGRGSSGGPRGGRRERGSQGSSRAVRAPRCAGRPRTGPRTITPGAPVPGRNVSDAADLGVSRSYQQEEIPAAAAERVQHDLHTMKCACGKEHAAPRPAGVPPSALSIGPRLRALAVYLVVFQHVPVDRCRQLIADVTGALVSDGFVHSCLARAASLAAGVTALLRALITASPVAGFDETTLRSGPAGEKKYVHGAFTEEYSAFWLGTRGLDTMEDAGILPGFAGVAVSDRYQNYFNPRWEHIAGNQACLSHLLRDFEDCAESYPGAVWPAQAQRALRGLIREWHAAREQGLPLIPAVVRDPLAHEFRHAVLAGLASVPELMSQRVPDDGGDEGKSLLAGRVPFADQAAQRPLRGLIREW